jgi:outer membrane protein OmpA-like peptidoglycan-associated protein/tetratricopeptide (TPR) repeat protein
VIKNFLHTALFLLLSLLAAGQDESSCPEVRNKRANQLYDKAVQAYVRRNYSDAIRMLNDLLGMEQDYVDAYYILALINIERPARNLRAAEENLKKVIALCPDYAPSAYFYLGQICFGKEDYACSVINLEKYLGYADRIKSEDDYFEATEMLKLASFYNRMLNNPVPFDPRPVEGISTPDDEYLPIITPDNDYAFFTRRTKTVTGKDQLFKTEKFTEKFMFSKRHNGDFSAGEEMPYPFNVNDNEGGATLTIDNKKLYYTICQFNKDQTYFNCDICWAEFVNGHWSDIMNLGDSVNNPDTWESQPTITSDGNTLYFISDRHGGFGGYDIYRTDRHPDGSWGRPVNLGPVINTPGNEKSPFIHTDSQTLYYSSDGLTGFGGYDIFYSRLREDGKWTEPKNIGYPINSGDDDVGFFVSTDGNHGFFCSNKFNGGGDWDLYQFELYEEARPEKVLFVKGTVTRQGGSEPPKARIELKNLETKKITEIPVDTLTGTYAAAVLFRNDYIMTIKSSGYAYESKYFAEKDTVFDEPARVEVELKPIETGKSYRLNDIYFDFNSSDLKPSSMAVIDGFIEFLHENPAMKVSIQGHTDHIGSVEDNQILSENRARAVYDYLVDKGVADHLTDYKGFGELRPVATNLTEEGRALNRRTEFVIVSK